MFFAGLILPFLSVLQFPELPPLDIENFAPESREAIRTAYEEFRQRPQDVFSNGQLGMVMHAHEQYDVAEICYSRAHMLDPKAFEWQYYLGITQGLLGKQDESILNLREALKRKADYLPGKIKLAEALFNAGKITESIDLFRIVLAENRQLALAHYGLGRALIANGQVTEGIDHLLEACNLFPDFGSAHYTLGLAYRDWRENKKAKEHFTLYMKHKNSWPDDDDVLLDQVKGLKSGALVRLHLGVKLAKNNRIDEAIREHERALELDPQLVQAHVHLIRLYAQASQPDKAVLHYRKAVEINPNLAESHYNFGVLMSRQDRYKEAAEAFQKALNINPHYADAHCNLGTMLQLEGRLDEAAEHFREAIRNDPTHRLARFNLGRILIARGKNQEAIEQFSMILRPEDEDTPRYMYALAAAYARAGEVDKAVVYAERAKTLATDLGQAELTELIKRDLQILKKAVKPQ